MATNIGKMFGTDKVAEQKGIDIEIGDDIVVRLARAGGANKAFKNAVISQNRANRRQAELSNEKGEQILRELFARHCVLGWSGVKDADDNEIPYSVEAYEEIWQEAPDFHEKLFGIAGDMESFQSQEREREAKS